MLSSEKEKDKLKKIILLLIKKVDKCEWINHSANGINYYEFDLGKYRLTLSRSTILQHPPTFISIKQSHSSLLEQYWDQSVNDLYILVDKKYDTVERERKKQAEETISAIMDELNKI